MCDLCNAIPCKPRRLSACKHVLCGICAASTVDYFLECPVCSVPLVQRADLEGDDEHDRVIKLRIDALPDRDSSLNKRLLQGWQGRFATLEKEATRAGRLIFEYGNTCEEGAAGKPKVAVFVRRVPQSEGGIVIGEQCLRSARRRLLTLQARKSRPQAHNPDHKPATCT